MSAAVKDASNVHILCASNTLMKKQFVRNKCFGCIYMTFKFQWIQLN